ncbi:hypothetical protein AAFC00_005498 [Neodothiora populina]|uniref:Zn(2)-C6 fungal-type domain-containing protein n=1 Tax=Neodothiora populina TaxID=2781224 RepID=A0ABR3PL43_9PEZI
MPPQSQSAEGGVGKNARRSAKSRSGCQTCKVKRLKCDESKPACKNCVKRGLTCPGYKQLLRWSTKYEAVQAADGPSQKTIHPSVEFQFSAIDPSNFGKEVSEDSGKDSIARKNVPENAGPREIIFANDGASAPSQEERDSAQKQLMPNWKVDLSQLLNPVEEEEDDALVRFEPQPSQSIVQRRSDDEARRRPDSRGSVEASLQWKTLLRSYYRMSEPALPRSLHSEASALVEHYFRDVCVIFSAFDSAMNPFRTVIARLWDNSSSIFFAIQSMAAAHLANYMPNMRLVGLNMQRKAYECLQQELQLASINQTMDDKLLLAVLLLGLTACWHDSSDLGAAHLTAARALIYPRLLRDDGLQGTESNRNDQFFAEALIYWEMCMAFVSRETFVPGMERRLPAAAFGDHDGRSENKIFPHPWTGIAPRIQMLFAEVGRLVRHYCTMRFSLFSPTGDPLAIDMDSIIIAAKDLEEELLSINLPSADDLVDVQDERTHKTDFISIAEATKCAALLEIYRVFPEILEHRLGSPGGMGGDAFPQAIPSFFSTDTDYTSTNRSRSTIDSSRWLTSLARHILDVIGKVPTSSGTRPLQLILLTTAAAELRLKGVAVTSPGLLASTTYDLEVAQARGFAMARLNELASRLPSKPVLKIIQLVREVWRRNDAGDDAFWMDVMTENGWETIMG